MLIYTSSQSLDLCNGKSFTFFFPDNFPRLVLGGFEDSYVAASPKDIKIPFQHPSLDTRLKHLSSQAPEVSPT